METLSRGWMQADCGPGWGDNLSSPLCFGQPAPAIYQASLQGRSLCATGRASMLRLELPQGKLCLFGDRLGPYEISFLINPRGSNAPEMQRE